VGVLSSFTSGLELFADPVAGDPGSTVPFTSYSVVSNNFPLPTPLVIPFNITNSGYASMNTSTAGRYVQLTNVFFGTNAGNYIQTGFYSVTNKSGQSFKLWFFRPGLGYAQQHLSCLRVFRHGVMFGQHESERADQRHA